VRPKLRTCNSILAAAGHATIYTVVPLAYGEYYGRWTAALLWYYVLRTSLRVRRTGGRDENR